MESVDSDDLLICATCGVQYQAPASRPLKACKICDDPRQYVPPSGQQWTSLRALKGSHTNVFELVEETSDIWSIRTEPKMAIGQRCFLIRTPTGNILWDCITYLDDDTINTIKDNGGLKAIVISHPHYFSTHLLWAATFDCPVYLSVEDMEWCTTTDTDSRRKALSGEVEYISTGICAIKLGGHFPGSLVLRYQPEDASAEDAHLFIADTFMTAPSALYHVDRPAGTTSFSFMWSYPNQIPLSAHAIYKMWSIVKHFQFGSTHGAFAGQDVKDKSIRRRVFESRMIQCRAMGWDPSNSMLLRDEIDD